jgi:hypothetical protein
MEQLIEMKQIFKKEGIIVLSTKENVYTREKEGEEMGEVEKVVCIKWAYWTESFPKHHAGTLICESPSLLAETTNILRSDSCIEFTRRDIIFYAVRHLSVLIDCCRENDIHFVDCTLGFIEDILSDAEFAVWDNEELVKNIRDYIWGMSD